jgi:hypothetical protein
MNRLIEKGLEFNRKIYTRIFPRQPHRLAVDFVGQKASDYIRRLLRADKPCMVARFGATELNCLLNYLGICSKDNLLNKIYKYITNENTGFWWRSDIKYHMRVWSGFFPANNEYLARFAEVMLECLPNVDVLGSWLEEEVFFESNLKKSKIVPLADIEPYYHAEPWSAALQDKKVLVIHPFDVSITSQYKKRERLFVNKNVLPKFQLSTLKAVQSIAGGQTKYQDWFAALDDMKYKITRQDYDVAIIGCGAYGFPLASFVKEQGKKAIHMGGAVQLLFGIKGRRWDNDSSVNLLYNRYWVRPSPAETPTGSQKVEDGCYW